MADPETDRCDIYEAEKSLGGLVARGSDTSGVFQLVAKGSARRANVKLVPKGLNQQPAPVAA